MERVIIINDCKFESTILKDMLLNLGYDVEITNEYEALRMMKDYYPDLVIANLIMKETTGDLLIEKIKQKSPGIRCFLSSCNNINMKDYEGKKVDGIIKTPVKMQRLEELLSADINKKSNHVEIHNDTRKQIDGWMEKMKDRVKEIEADSVEASAAANFTFCPFCGKKLGAAGKFVFCPYCGNKIKS